MGYLTSLITILVALVLACLAFPRPAYAYLDPGTGSYILQLILAALLGAAFAVKLFWKDVKAFFGKLFSRQEDHEEEED
jgi:hypothetical protein